MTTIKSIHALPTGLLMSTDLDCALHSCRHQKVSFAFGSV
jgi:hypothetical protein